MAAYQERRQREVSDFAIAFHDPDKIKELYAAPKALAAGRKWWA